jgi:hypothetical protein
MHNYLKKQLKITQEKWFIERYGKPGTFHMIWSHDDDCGIFRQRLCNCDPDYKIVTFDKPKEEENWLKRFYKKAKVGPSAMLFRPKKD